MKNRPLTSGSQNLENRETIDWYLIIQTKPVEQQIEKTLNGYSMWEHVRIPLMGNKKIYEDFIIKEYNKKDETFTVYKEMNNWVITTKVPKDILDYYNKEEYEIWQDVIIIIKWTPFEGRIIEFNEKEIKYLVERREWNNRMKRRFSKKKLDSYEDSVFHVIGENRYVIGNRSYKKEKGKFIKL